VLDAAQLLGQLLAARLALGFVNIGGGTCLALQGIELGLQIRLVLGGSVLEHLALLGVHALGARAKLPGLQAGQLEGDLLELGVLELDFALVALRSLLMLLDLAALRAQLGQHAGGELSHGCRLHRLQRLGVECLEIHHQAPIVRTSEATRIGTCADCPASQDLGYTTVMRCICSSRCQGKPRISASNCCWVRVSGVDDPSNGH